MADIISSDPEYFVEFIEDVIVYRLVWATEAVRVRSCAHQDEYAGLWTGELAEALEAGALDRSTVILIHAGLGSRVAAFNASDTDSDRSHSRMPAGRSADWPTPETSDLWRAILRSMDGESTSEWRVQTKPFRCDMAFH
jgi:hypothetical protein